jgi:hypothetical protein
LSAPVYLLPNYLLASSFRPLDQLLSTFIYSLFCRKYQSFVVWGKGG